MQLLAHRIRLERRPVAAIFLVATLLLTGSTGPSFAAQSLPNGFWKDPDGNPLPFSSEEAIIEFLESASIESVADIELGVTNPRRVVLEKDGLKMRAALRDYDETFEQRRFDDVFYGRLRDSYVFDVPAYQLAKLLGVIRIPPVAFRRIGSNPVSVQIWLEGGLMETDRVAEGIEPPSALRYSQQTQNMRVFDSVIGNVDRNTGNILFDSDWNMWLIDHSRSFLRNDDYMRYLDRIESCSRELYNAIKGLTAEKMMPVMSPPLTASEVDWVLRRRDRVVEHIDALIAEKGEGGVLFDGS